MSGLEPVLMKPALAKTVTILKLLFVVIAIAALTPSYGLAADGYVIEIRGTINPATSRYLTRAIEAAEEAKAEFLLVELDTPGGLVSSVREMAQAIDRSKVPIIVYTTPAGASATSAGAILMISSHLAAMAPGTNMGAAHPVGAEGEDIKGAMGEKAVNDISAFARSMAALRNRDVKAAAEVVAKSKSYTANEALKANLIEVVAADREELWTAINNREISAAGLTTKLNTKPAPTLHPVEMTFGEKILHYLSHPNIAAILMTLGILFIYAEISAPGLGLPGILGGMCLIVAFIAFQALPIQTGGLVLLGIGAALIIAEVFVGSGGALAFGGSAALILGLIWVIDPTATDLRIAPTLIWVIGAVFLTVTLLLGYGLSKLKRGKASPLGLKDYIGVVVSTTPDGKTGQARIRGELWKFVSNEPLKVGDSVTVINSNGLELFVKHEKG